jgi:hypothetical protein
MLVVQSTREINELRYVLCPKRMSDATFWQIYFALARKRLPDAAFEPAPAAARAAPSDAMSLADLQVRARARRVPKVLARCAPGLTGGAESPSLLPPRTRRVLERQQGSVALSETREAP